MYNRIMKKLKYIKLFEEIDVVKQDKEQEGYYKSKYWNTDNQSFDENACWNDVDSEGMHAIKGMIDEGAVGSTQIYIKSGPFPNPAYGIVLSAYKKMEININHDKNNAGYYYIPVIVGQDIDMQETYAKIVVSFLKDEGFDAYYESRFD